MLLYWEYWQENVDVLNYGFLREQKGGEDRKIQIGRK